MSRQMIMNAVKVGNTLLSSDIEEASKIVGLGMRIQDGLEAQKELEPMVKTEATEVDLKAKLEAIRHDETIKDSDILYPADARYVEVDGKDLTWKKHKADAKDDYTRVYCSDEAVGNTLDKIQDARDEGTLDVKKCTVKALKNKPGHSFRISGTIGAQQGVRDTPKGHLERLQAEIAEKRAEQADS